MIISHRHKFIFMHCRKTGGSSITALLNNYLGPHDIQIGSWVDAIASGGQLNNHIFRILLVKALRQPDFIPKLIKMFAKNDKIYISKKVNVIVKQKYRKVISERPEHAIATRVKQFDPYSWENYFKFCFVRNPFDMAVSDFYWTKAPEKGVNFEEFLLRKRDLHRPDPERIVARPITNWEIYTIDDQIAVDFVGRFENMYDDLLKIGKFLNFDSPLQLPRWKAKGHTRKTRGLDLYNPKTIALVEELYQQEIREFNYSFEDFAKSCSISS